MKMCKCVQSIKFLSRIDSMEYNFTYICIQWDKEYVAVMTTQN